VEAEVSRRLRDGNANEACFGMPRSFAAAVMGLALIGLCLPAPAVFADEPKPLSPKPFVHSPDQSASGPHADAIRLVVEQRSDEILALDGGEDMRWFDTRTRSWSVRRPHHPGVFDTRFLMVVIYSIDGEEVGRWTVNTCTGEVSGKAGEPVSTGGCGRRKPAPE
jgi:hypothetical protein